jgi:hypothetical protein
MTSLEFQPFGTVFLLKITIGGSFEPSAVMQRITVKFDLSWPTFQPIGYKRMMQPTQVIFQGQ